jgi:hypothetical protein
MAPLICGEQTHFSLWQKGGKAMKKAWFLGLVVSLAVLLSLTTLYAQSRGHGYYGGPGGGGGYGGWYCPWCGQAMGPGGGYGTGPGMMGPGMMHHGGGMGHHHGPQYAPQYGPQYEPRYQQPPKPMEEKDAKEILKNYLRSTRNPNLKVGEIKDKGSVFEAEIVTKKEGALVDKIAVDKYSGWMRSVY